MTSAKRSYKYQGREKEEGQRKYGKTTSESGPVSISTPVREQPKTVRYGRRLSPMSTVNYDPDGSGTQVTGNGKVTGNGISPGVCNCTISVFTGPCV